MTPDGPLVLVVDDQDSGRYVKARVLRGAGFRVLEAATGTEALEIASAQAVAVAVLDVNLPDIHGFEVCRRLKSELARSQTVPVLQISNTAVSDGDRIQGLQ
jgi:CheY-like chemotaxis protein